MYRPRRHESLIDEQIRQAQERGEFDNLPGKGKPLPGLGGPDDDLWWVKGFVEREGLPSDALLPPSLQLRKEIERLPETLRELSTEDAVRLVVADLNRRIVEWVRLPSGPVVPLRRVDVERAVVDWRAARSARPGEQAAPASGAGPHESAGRPVRRRWWSRAQRVAVTDRTLTNPPA